MSRKKSNILIQANKQKCSLTLKELETNRSKFEFITDKNLIPSSTYINLVLFSPSKQSNLGKKLSTKISSHIDELTNDLISMLDIKQTYFYSSIESDKDKIDLHDMILNSQKPFLALFCSDGFVESLYASIRNALAHGNIAKKGKFYFLYAVSKQKGVTTPEKDKNLTFLLKLKQLEKISSYVEVFEKYN